MAAAAEQISRLRRMVGEPDATTYTDTDLAGYIERFPLMDFNGHEQWLSRPTAQLPGLADPSWVPTYDLNAAAADLWDEKAAKVAADFDLNADGAATSRGQVYQHYMAQARYYRSRMAVQPLQSRAWPQRQEDVQYIGNLPERDE